VNTQKKYGISFEQLPTVLNHALLNGYNVTQTFKMP